MFRVMRNVNIELCRYKSMAPVSLLNARTPAVAGFYKSRLDARARLQIIRRWPREAKTRKFFDGLASTTRSKLFRGTWDA